jgi:hypothetical protein
MANAFDQFGPAVSTDVKPANAFDQFGPAVPANAFDQFDTAPVKPYVPFNPAGGLPDIPAEPGVVSENPENHPFSASAGAALAQRMSESLEPTFRPSMGLNRPVPEPASFFPKTAADWRERGAQMVEAAPMGLIALAAVQPEVKPLQLALAAAGIGGAASALADQIRGKPADFDKAAVNAAIWSLVPSLPTGEIALRPSYEMLHPVMTVAAKIVPQAVVAGGEGLSLNALYQLGTNGKIDWDEAVRTGGFTGGLGLLLGTTRAYDTHNASMASRQNLINYARDNFGGSAIPEGMTWNEFRQWGIDQWVKTAKARVAGFSQESTSTTGETPTFTQPQIGPEAPPQIAGTTAVESLKSVLPVSKEGFIQIRTPADQAAAGENQLPPPTLESGKLAAERVAPTEMDLLKQSVVRGQANLDFAHQREMDLLERDAAVSKARREALDEQQKLEQSSEMFQLRQKGETLKQNLRISLEQAKAGTQLAQLSSQPPAPTPPLPVDKVAAAMARISPPETLANAAARTGKDIREHPEAAAARLAPFAPPPADLAQPAPVAQPGEQMQLLSGGNPDILDKALKDFRDAPTVTLDRLNAMTPQETVQNFQALQAGGGFTELALKARSFLSGNAEALAKLVTMQDEAGKASDAAKKVGDLPTALALAYKGQFFRELHEAATGTGSMAREVAKRARAEARAGTPAVIKNAELQLAAQAKGAPGELPQLPKPAPMGLIHFSSEADLKTVNPEFLGKAFATRHDLAGIDKAFYYEEGSPMGQDEGLTNAQGHIAYRAEIPAAKLYDWAADPEGLVAKNMPNRETIEQAIKDAGYDGYRATHFGGSKVVAMFKPLSVKKIQPPTGESANAIAQRIQSTGGGTELPRIQARENIRPYGGQIREGPGNGANGGRGAEVSGPVQVSGPRPPQPEGAPGVRFAATPQTQAQFTSEFARVAKTDNAGATFNADGSPADLAQTPVIVTLGSRNFKAVVASPKAAANSLTETLKFFNDHAQFLSTPNAKPGLFHFGDTVSADLNVALPPERLALAKQFARDNNQNSIFDASTGKTIPTGGSGATILKTPAELAVAASQLADGTYRNIAGVRTSIIVHPSGVRHGHMTSGAAHLTIPVSEYTPLVPGNILPQISGTPAAGGATAPAAPANLGQPAATARRLALQHAQDVRAKLAASVVAQKPAAPGAPPPPPPPGAPPAAPAAPGGPRRPGIGQISLLNPTGPGAAAANVAARGVVGPFNAAE